MRSTWTNAFIRNLLFLKDTKITVNDGEEDHVCGTFRQIADVMDSVDEVVINIHVGGSDPKRAWFHFIMCNDDDEQLCDYLATDFADGIVKSVQLTGDE